MTTINPTLWRRITAAYQVWKADRAVDYLTKTSPAALFASPVESEGKRSAQDPAVNLSAYEIDEFINVAATAISESLTAAPLIPERLETIDGNKEWIAADQSEPIAQTLLSPNPDESLLEILWRNDLTLSLDGNGFWMTPSDDRIFWLDTSWVKKISTDEEGLVTQYHLEYKGKMQTFDRDEIIHFRWPHYKQSQFGFSKIKPATIPILLNYHGSRYLKNYFKDSAVPGGLLSTDHPDPGPKAREAAAKHWRESYGGTERAHRVAMLSWGYKYQQITPNLKDMVVKDLFTMSRENKLAIMGIVPVLAGILDGATYANAKAQMEILWRNKLIPRMKLREAAINMQWVPRFGKNLRVRHDLSQVEALQTDKEIQDKRAVMIWQGGIGKLNEARKRAELEPVEDGDMFRWETLGNTDFDTNGGGQEGDGKTSYIRPLTRVVKTDDPRHRKWKVHYQVTRRAEGRFESTMNGFFREQKGRVLEALDNFTSGGKNMAALGLWLTKVDPPPDDSAAIFNILTENELIIGSTHVVTESVIKDAGARAAHEVSLGFDFNLHDPQVEVMFQQFENRIVKVNSTTYRDIKKILQVGYDEGLGIDEIANRIRDQYGLYLNGSRESVISRSRKIAITEMNGAVNGGARQGYRQIGIKQLEWLSAFLPDSRPEHMAADGEKADIDGSWDIGGERLKFPGDPGGSPGNICNCHCAVSPVVED